MSIRVRGRRKVAGVTVGLATLAAVSAGGIGVLARGETVAERSQASTTGSTASPSGTTETVEPSTTPSASPTPAASTPSAAPSTSATTAPATAPSTAASAAPAVAAPTAAATTAGSSATSGGATSGRPGAPTSGDGAGRIFEAAARLIGPPGGERRAFRNHPVLHAHGAAAGDHALRRFHRGPQSLDLRVRAPETPESRWQLRPVPRRNSSR